MFLKNLTILLRAMIFVMGALWSIRHIVRLNCVNIIMHVDCALLPSGVCVCACAACVCVCKAVDGCG